MSFVVDNGGTEAKRFLGAPEFSSWCVRVFRDARVFATADEARKQRRPGVTPWRRVLEVTWGVVWCDSRGEEAAGARYYAGRNRTGIASPMWSHATSQAKRYESAALARADIDSTPEWAYQERNLKGLFQGAKVVRFLRHVK